MNTNHQNDDRMGGRDETDSAKQRQRNAYKQDLELQIQEKQAARQRERLQDMNVNASGFLDPEKRPDRFKPLGGAHWLDQREKRNTDRVRPYHTLFLYDKDNTPSTNAASGAVPNSAVDQAYNFYGAQDLTRGAGGGGVPLVQPISIPHGDNRPIIVHAPGGGDIYQGPRFNPFEKKDDNSSRDFQSLLIITQSEKDRIRRENEEFQRRLRQELDDERKRIIDQENEAKRRLDELRRMAEERRREAEKERKEVMRLKRLQEQKPQTEPPRPKSKKTMLYYDMDDYRLKLIEERKKIEELLKAGKPTKEVWDLKVVEKPPRNIPPTPKTGDKANKDNVNDFNSLKFKDGSRNEFRTVFPDIPMTNKRLEEQQEALLHQQEASFRDHAFKAAPPKVDVPPRRAISRPNWLDRDPTPFPHVLKQRDRLYASQSETDLSNIDRKARDRMMALENPSPTNDDAMEGLKLRNHRCASTETLVDDTWLRPSSTSDI